MTVAALKAAAAAAAAVSRARRVAAMTRATERQAIDRVRNIADGRPGAFSDDDLRVLVTLAEEAVELRRALRGLIAVCKCTNGCEPDDMTCATNRARRALSPQKRHKK